MKKWLVLGLVICILSAVFYTIYTHYPPTQVLIEDNKPKGIHTKDAAVSFLLGKFSISELKDFVRKYKSGSPQEKEEVKAALKQRMTEEEFQDINSVLQGELEKQSNK